MRRIHGDRRQNGLDLFPIKLLDNFLCIGAQFLDFAHADGFAAQPGNEVFAPASVLVLHKRLQLGGKPRQQLGGRKPVRADLAAALLGLLQKAGDANFYEFVEIVGGNGQELHPLEQRIRRIVGLFEHAAVELQPRKVPVDIESRILKGGSAHLHRFLCAAERTSAMLQRRYAAPPRRETINGFQECAHAVAPPSPG